MNCYSHEIDDFPLESLSYHLLAYIVEKITFEDYISLNQCSKFSVDLCGMVPKEAKLSVQLGYVAFNEDRYRPSLGLGNNRFVLKGQVPSFVRINCKYLVLQDKRWTMMLIRLFQIKSYDFSIRNCDFTDDEMEELYKICKPEKVSVDPCFRAMLRLDLFQKARDLYVFCSDGIDDATMLTLKAPLLSLYGDKNQITAYGIADFLNQWRLGQREIQYVKIRASEVGKEEIFEYLENYTDKTYYFLVSRNFGKEEKIQVEKSEWNWTISRYCRPNWLEE